MIDDVRDEIEVDGCHHCNELRYLMGMEHPERGNTADLFDGVDGVGCLLECLAAFEAGSGEQKLLSVLEGH